MKRKIYQKEFYVIGHTLWKVNRDLCNEIIDTYVRPQQRFPDFSLIPVFYKWFCEIRNLSRKRLQGTMYNSQLTHERRLFISCMIRLYNHQIYFHPREAMIIRVGFSSALCKVLGISTGHVSKYIKTCVVHEKVYVEIRQEVDDIVMQLESMYEKDPEGRGVEQSG